MKELPHICEDERLDDINAGLRLIRKKDGLTFGTDALLLASYVTPRKNALCVDLGSGTGVLCVLLAKTGKVGRALGVEIQGEYATLIEKNAVLNGLSDRVLAYCSDVRHMTQQRLGEVLGCERAGGLAADIVVCNPPYMPAHSGKRNEDDGKYLARHEVCGGIADFCAAAARILRFGGEFYVVWRPDRLSELMQALSDNRFGITQMTFVHGDEAAQPSTVLMCAKLGASPTQHITPPLLLHTADSRGQRTRPLTPMARQVTEALSIAPLIQNERGR